MSYVDGFVIALPTASKEEFIAHARGGEAASLAALALLLRDWASPRADAGLGSTT